MKHICSALKRNGDKKGFTLVELIVVIAILAILAAVAYPVYTGYIDYTNKGVDKTTVGEIMHALELADYADSTLFEEGASLSVYITEEGTQAIPKLSAALSDAMDPATTRLTYDKWNGVADLLPQMAAIADTIDDIGLDAMWDGTVTDSNGNIPSALYAAKADEMWEKVIAEAEKREKGSGKKAGLYIQDAAKYTVETGITSGSDMGSAWTQQRVADSFDASTGADAVSGPAAIMARHNAFATYLKANGYSVSDETIAALCGDGLTDQINNFMTQSIPSTGSKYTSDWDVLKEAANKYLNDKTYTGTNGTQYSQAYIDGMVYYGLMYNVNRLTGTGSGQFDPNGSDYLDKLGTIVSMTGNVLSGTYSADDLKMELNLFDKMKETTGSVVCVKATKTGGVLNIKVWPEDANPRNDKGTASEIGTCEETIHHEAITIAHISLGDKNVPQYNNKTLTGSIQICSKNKINCTVTGGSDIVITELTTTDTSIIKINGMTVEALRSGTATVTCKGTYKGSEFTTTLTFNVH